MSAEESLTPAHEVSSPTSIRYLVLAAGTMMAVLLYLDRYAVTIPLEYIREDLRMTQTQLAWFISAFFWSYALCQVPAGWLSDRFGARVMLSVYIISWSAMTGLMGVSHAIWMMLWLRVFCGASQAGAYPTAAGMIRQWYPASQRGSASSVVGLGGRFGGVLAPLLTSALIIWFVSSQPEPRLTNADVLNDDAFIARFDLHRLANSQTDLDLPRMQFVTAFLNTVPQSQRDTLAVVASGASKKVQDQETGNTVKSSSFFDLHDWIPHMSDPGGVVEKPRSDGLEEIVQSLSVQMSTADFFDFATKPGNATLKMPRDSQRFLDRHSEGIRLSEPDTILLNRYVLETLFPAEIRKSQGQGWRQTMIVYGILGIAIALVFMVVIRNTPQHHPWCNAAEKNFINDEATQRLAALEPQNPVFPFRAFLMDLSLWGNSLCQFLTNVGWLFIVTSLPRFLDKVHGVSLVTIGIMTAFPIGSGIFGLLGGGRCTDWAVRRLGLKWGRRLPLAISRFTAAAGYGICVLLGILIEPGPDKDWLPWLFIASLCIAAASTDFGTPAIWAYSQDVGGRYTASILGWGNMWGNLGAAVAPHIYNKCLGETPTIANWNGLFAICCGAFIVSGLCAMLLDATKSLTTDRSPT